MPGELGNEDEQMGVGYYERRYPTDSDPNLTPKGTIEDMKAKISKKSIMNVLRNYSKPKEQ
jgi:hypothetical protein